MNLPEQIKSILLSGKLLKYAVNLRRLFTIVMFYSGFLIAKAMQFAQLDTLLSKNPDVTDMTVIQCLQQVAILVQGCWIIKRFYTIDLKKWIKRN